MLNRKQSLFKGRRESLKSLGLKSRIAEIPEVESDEVKVSEEKFPGLGALKISEDEIKNLFEKSYNTKEMKNEIRVVRKVSTSNHKKKSLHGVILKHIDNKFGNQNLQLLSSLNARPSIDVFEDKKMNAYVIPRVNERKSIEKRASPKLISDNSFHALENWKIRMQERRQLQTSLARRLQTNPESLLMSQSAQNTLYSTYQDNLLQILFPFFQNGTGAPITRSIWPEKEVTKQNLQIQSHQWKPKIPFEVTRIGYDPRIIKYMEEYVTGSTNFKKIKMKDSLFQDNRFQETLKDYNYTSPNLVDFLCRNQQSTGIKSIENTTIIQSDSENTIDSSEKQFIMLGPHLLINDEILSGTFADEEYDNNLKIPHHLHINFPTTVTDFSSSQIIYLANRGSCSIQYSWKKAEITKCLKYPDISPVFFFKINNGIILPDSNALISITFKSKIPGFFDELWELSTEPKLSDFRILLHFHAISLTPDYLIEKRESIQEEIYRSTKDQTVKDIIDEILLQVTSCKSHKKEADKGSINYDEEEIFTHMNPKVPWNFDKVQEFKLMGSQILEINWDLSMSSMKKDLYHSTESGYSESVIEEFQRICCDISLPLIGSWWTDNGLFNSRSDVRNICYVKLNEAIDKAEKIMGNITKLLQIEKYVYTRSEEKDLPKIVVQNKESPVNKNVSNQQKDKDHSGNGNESGTNSALTSKFLQNRKLLFRSKANYSVQIIIGQLLEELDLIFLRE